MTSSCQNADLQRRLMAAHDLGDLAALAELFAEAADLAEVAGEIDRACFFLTQAWVFAMDAGAPVAKALRARLVAYGRDVDDNALKRET